MFPVTFCTEVIIRAILRCGNHHKSFFRILQWLSECPLTVALLRTRITRAISFNLLLTRLLGSNNSNSKTLQTPITSSFFYFNKKLIFYHFLIICTCHTYISFTTTTAKQNNFHKNKKPGQEHGLKKWDACCIIAQRSTKKTKLPEVF